MKISILENKNGFCIKLLISLAHFIFKFLKEYSFLFSVTETQLFQNGILKDQMHSYN